MNYILRTTPPVYCSKYVADRDRLVRRVLGVLLNIGEDFLDLPKVQPQIHLPAKFGGLGLHSALMDSPAAYWASWADALPGIYERMPDFLNVCRPVLTQLVVDPQSAPPTSTLRN